VVLKGALVRDVIETEGLDILAISETWLSDADPRAVTHAGVPPGYTGRFINRSTSAPTSRGGGLALFYRDSFRTKTHPLQSAFTRSTFELQIVTVIVGKNSFVLVNIYRPPVPSLTKFCEELSDLFSKLSGVIAADRIVFCGDFNCPGVDALSVSDSIDSILDTFGLVQHVTSHTFVGPHGPSLLDLVLTNRRSTRCTNISTRTTNLISDHSLIIWLMQTPLNRRTPITYSYRNLKALDLELFKEHLLKSVLFSNPAASTNTFVKQFNSVVSDALDTMAPLRSRTKCAGKPNSRWLSPEANCAKRWRRRLERRWKSTRREKDRKLYREACRRANILINASLKQHYAGKINLAARGSRQQWRAVKDVLHSSVPTETLTDNELNGLCNNFASYFQNKVHSIKLAINSSLQDAGLISNPLSSDNPHIGAALTDLKPVTVSEVDKLLSSLSGKSSPMDILPTTLLKSCAAVFSPLIAYMANLSFAEGVFPSIFLTASVTPLLKKDGLDPDNPANYRPISNLNTISKILERLFLARLLPHVNASPNFNSYQSAYRKAHSTETALLKILDDIYRAIGNHNPTLLIALDISAAFDTIDHLTLINRLEQTFGISSVALDWILSYLSGRSQFVRLGNCTSAPHPCPSGVPQGSVLGPLLFTLYISPVANVISSFGISHHQYADDTQLYSAIDRASFTQASVLDCCATAVHRWFILSGLALYPDKSEAIPFGTASSVSALQAAVPTVTVAGSSIGLAGQVKNLGIILDSHLSFNSRLSLSALSSNWTTPVR
jgi:hypothetical protein